MSNDWFAFKKFTIQQSRSAMKVGTDSILLGAWVDVENATSVLDVGSGTGLLSLMMAQRSDALIHGVENNHEAYLDSLENIKTSPWLDRIRVYNITFQEFSSGIRQNQLKYDLIISNPPYFQPSPASTYYARKSARQTTELSFEELLSGVNALLAEDGNLCIVLPVPEGDIFMRIAETLYFNCNRVLNIKYTSQSPVKRRLMQFCKQKKELISSDIAIMDNTRNQYTEEYKTLTGDYYL